ncbi:MAG: AI-2E family transporter [Selenomonadaceae bacterium]|nr:AI-2E family transporter [Selenomonadaceae bacterium]MBP3722570.1 AI-2E family transporter [Selenomonadaceae bacterium]
MNLKPYRVSIFIIILAVLTISLFWFMQSLAIIIFLSVLLALLLKPLADTLAKKLPRALATGISLVAFISFFVTLITIITQSFLPAFTAFIADFPNISRQFYERTNALNLTFLTTDLDNIWNELFNTGIVALKSSLGLLLSLFNKVIDGVVILFVAFYFIEDSAYLKSQITNLFPKSAKERVSTLIKNILTALHAYLSGQLIICMNTGLIVFVYYMLRDIPYAPVFAVISAVAEFIPVLGPTVASVFGILITLTISPILSLQTALFYLILTQVNHNVVYPTIIGKKLNIHPVAIILSIVLGGELLGAMGMFLAVPVVTTCKIIIEDIYDDYVKNNEN